MKHLPTKTYKSFDIYMPSTNEYYAINRNGEYIWDNGTTNKKATDGIGGKCRGWFQTLEAAENAIDLSAV